MKQLDLTLAALLLYLTAFSANAQGEPLKVVSVVNGALGDKSFFDSAERGMEAIAEAYDIATDTIELGLDPANWEAGLLDMMADTAAYDILIAGSFQMAGFLAENAHKYPDKRFIFYDAALPYADAETCLDACANVYSMTFAQNEGAFLAGIYAAAITTSALEGANEAPIIGAVGGQPIPVINNFIVGYEQGACLVNPGSRTIVQYVGSWSDPARGKEIALAMYEQEADIVFQAAGGSGVGVLEAAQEQARYAIGAGMDQAALVAETDPEQAAHILTSMLQHVDIAIVRAVSLHLEGALPYGASENLGIAEGVVGIARNAYYQAATPEPVKAMIDAAEQAVVEGAITVQSVFAAEDERAVVGTPCADMPTARVSIADFVAGG